MDASASSSSIVGFAAHAASKHKIMTLTSFIRFTTPLSVNSS
jgi:hypothetical protein